MNQPNSRAETVPKIANLKLSSCGLQKKLWLRNCEVAVVEQHLFKSFGIAIAEVLPSSCGIAIADSKKSSACPRLSMLTHNKDSRVFFSPKNPTVASIQSTCLLFLHTVHSQDNKKFRPVGYFGNRLWYLRCQTLNFGMFKNVCGKKFCFLLLKAKIQSHHSSYPLLCAKENVSNFAGYK
jgi:hypothetical protein